MKTPERAVQAIRTIMPKEDKDKAAISAVTSDLAWYYADLGMEEHTQTFDGMKIYSTVPDSNDYDECCIFSLIYLVTALTHSDLEKNFSCIDEILWSIEEHNLSNYAPLVRS